MRTKQRTQEITSSRQFRRMVAEGGWTDAPFREILIWGSSRLPRPGERAFAARSGLTANGIRVVAVEVHSDDSHTGLFVEEMDEIADLFFPENSAYEIALDDMGGLVATFEILEDGPVETDRLVSPCRGVPEGERQIHDANIVAIMLACEESR